MIWFDVFRNKYVQNEELNLQFYFLSIKQQFDFNKAFDTFGKLHYTYKWLDKNQLTYF